MKKETGICLVLAPLLIGGCQSAPAPSTEVDLVDRAPSPAALDQTRNAVLWVNGMGCPF